MPSNQPDARSAGNKHLICIQYITSLCSSVPLGISGSGSEVGGKISNAGVACLDVRLLRFV